MLLWNPVNQSQFLKIHLNSIEVVELDLNELIYSQFPYLKHLKASSLVSFDGNTWNNFMAILFINGIENVEFICLGSLKISATESLALLFSNLKNLKYLKKVELYFENENLKIDMIKKSVRYSWSRNSNNLDFKNVLQVFKDFEIFDCENQKLDIKNFDLVKQES